MVVLKLRVATLLAVGNHEGKPRGTWVSSTSMCLRICSFSLVGFKANLSLLEMIFHIFSGDAKANGSHVKGAFLIDPALGEHGGGGLGRHRAGPRPAIDRAGAVPFAVPFAVAAVGRVGGLGGGVGRRGVVGGVGRRGVGGGGLIEVWWGLAAWRRVWRFLPI